MVSYNPILIESKPFELVFRATENNILAATRYMYLNESSLQCFITYIYIHAFAYLYQVDE